jgi:Fe2+ or Zn2+ uptake regulation protein
VNQVSATCAPCCDRIEESYPEEIKKCQQQIAKEAGINIAEYSLVLYGYCKKAVPID